MASVAAGVSEAMASAESVSIGERNLKSEKLATAGEKQAAMAGGENDVAAYGGVACGVVSCGIEHVASAASIRRQSMAAGNQSKIEENA